MRDGAPSELIAGAAGYRCVVDVWRGGEVIGENLPILAGSVTGANADDGPAESVSFSIARYADGIDYAPSSALDPLAPAGQRLSVRAFMEDPTTEIEYETQVGTFLLDSTEEVEDGLLEVSGVGLTRLLADYGIVTAIPPRSDGTLLSELARLFPGGLALDVDPSIEDRACPQSLEWSDNRLAAIMTIVRALPARLRVDPWGMFQLLPALPDVPAVTTFTMTDGERVSADAIATVIRAPRKWTRDGIANVVVMRGADTDSLTSKSVIGSATQTAGDYAADMTTFGVVTDITTNSLLTTKAQALAAARTRLTSLLRPAQAIVVDCAPDPRVTLDDSMNVRRTENADGVWELDASGYVTNYTLPLVNNGDAMQFTVGVG